MQPTIRDEQPDDVSAIARIHEAAFARTQVAAIVAALRAAGAVTLSLVAVDAAGGVCGHVLFTPVSIREADGRQHVAALGPLAVAPLWQRRGIGEALVREGLARLRWRGITAVVVVGDPAYYTRLGFGRASALGLRWDREVADAAFMALELVPGSLAAGVVSYRPEFDAP